MSKLHVHVHVGKSIIGVQATLRPLMLIVEIQFFALFQPRHSLDNVWISGADPGINYEMQVGGAQVYEYNYERRGGAQEYSTM